MGFLGSSVVVVAMAIISACVGALGFLILRLDLDTALILAIAVFCVLVILQFSTWRGQDRKTTDRGFEDISRAIERLTRDQATIANRLSVLETAGAATATRDTAALRGDVEGLKRAIDEITLALTEQSEAVAGLIQGTVAALPPPAANEDGVKRGRFASLARADRVAILSDAIEAGRIELLLQPIVTLPQRKVRWYEVVTRVRTDRGETLLPEEVAAMAEEGGLWPRLDAAVIFRSVQLVRRLQARNREVGLTVDIAARSLADGESYREILEFLAANTVVAPYLVLEIRQDGYRGFGPLEFEAMTAIARHGYRFALDEARDLRFDGKDLADRSFKFVKVPADTLLGRAGALPADIHPADIADLLARFGVDLVADRIEAEATVVDLLDYDVRFGQGQLFSPPRPVRQDVLGDAPTDMRAAGA